MWELGAYTDHLSSVAFRATSTEGHDVVFVAGHLDLNTSAWARDRLVSDQRLNQPRLVLELSGVELLDSAGIGALALVHRTTRQRGDQLVLVTDDPHLRKLFKISAIDQVVPIHSTLESALGDVGDDPDGSEPATAS